MSAAAALPTVFMFSGQGSQYYGMGEGLFAEDEVFRTALRDLDAVVAEELGQSVLARMFDPARRRDEAFVDTWLTQPAIVMVELALARALAARGVEPDYVLGASLGEYAAAVVAGSLPAEACVRVLVRQARALAAGPGGGMLAVLAPLEVRERIPELAALEVAARNYPGHFVVAGGTAAIERAERAARAAGVLCQRVPVEHAYHSALMDEVLDAGRPAFEGVDLRPPRLPWISCVDGGLVERPDADHFWRVARRPIEFEQTMQVMRARGDFRFLDLGPSGTLHNFVRGNLPSGARSRSFALLSPFGHVPGVLERTRTLVAPPRAGTDTTRKADSMKVYGFPGQGSQQRGMGKELFASFPQETATADRVLGYSIEELCVRDPERQLGRTDFTQPALYVVGALSYLARVEEDPTPPDFVVGHSLGEYTALYAAGVFDFETGLRLVQKRGALMAAAGGGGMLAVVGVDEETVTGVLTDAGLDALDLANHNAPDQFVLSGPSEAIDTARTAFEAAGARAVRLNVSAPFHSRNMAATAEEFADFLAGFTLRPPTVPVLANVDALPYPPDEMGIRQRLADQIASPVRWTDTVRRLMGAGDFTFEELGPGRVLTKLVAKIRQNTEPLPAPVQASPPSAGSTPLDNATGLAPLVDAGVVDGDVVGSGDVAGATTTGVGSGLTADTLGAASFRERYGLRRAYLLGSLYGGVSGPRMLGAAAKAGLLGFLGTAGLPLSEVERQLRSLADDLGPAGAFGANVHYRHGAPDEEAALVDLLLRHGVPLVEASGFPLMTPALVRFRLKGGRILAKVSRSDVAAEFLAPPPERLVARLLASGQVTAEEARAAADRPMADDLCVEADGGWLVNGADLVSLLPVVQRMRDQAAVPGRRVHVGCAGGLGSPEAVAGAFLLGAEFVLTGSVNQCSVESGTSAEAKDLLQEAREHDVTSAPWGELFEMGVQARFLKRGLFFPARAQRLYEIWRRCDTMDELTAEERNLALERYLGGERPEPTTASSAEGKAELTRVFRHYFTRGLRLAAQGDRRAVVDFAVHCGPAMGAYNQVVADTEARSWHARTVESIAETLMEGAVTEIRTRLRAFG